MNTEEVMPSIDKSTNVRSMEPARMAPKPIQQSFRALEQLAPGLALRWLNKLFAQPARHTPPAEEKLLLAQAERRRFFTYGLPVADWNGKAIAAYRWRPEKPSFARVLLMHGWEGRAGQFHAFVPTLLQHGFEVIALDAPGHGASHGRWSSLFQFARAIDIVARGYGGIDAAITHSFGGPSLIMAMNEGLSVQKSVLIAPPVRVSDYTALLCQVLGVSESLRQRLHQHWQQKLGVELASLDAGFYARNLRSKALVIHDQHDKEVPVQAGFTIAENWPDAKFVATTQLGHRRIIREPAIIEQAIQFIGQ